MSSPESSKPNLFAVVSWGNAGTHWLAKLLNAHPEVFCLHNIKNPWRRETNGDQSLDSVTYFRVIDRAGSGYAAAGDVHGIAREDVPQLQSEWGDRFRACSLVRHPIPRIDSHYALREKTKGRHFYKLDSEALAQAVPKPLRGVLYSEEHLFFVHVMGLVNSLTVETALGPVFTLEKLSTDLAECNRLLRYVTQTESEFHPESVQPLFQRKVSSHRDSGALLNPADLFEVWPQWKQDAFGALLSPQAKGDYENLGYDLSFVSDSIK